MNNIKFVFITIFCLYTVCPIIRASCPAASSPHPSSQLPDYYWRDYVGVIPYDAVQGGTDKAGHATYVGQAYIKNYELLPSIIYPGCKFANTTAYVDEITTDKNIKILCSHQKYKFEWVPTKDEEVHLLSNRHVVVGGYEVGHMLNIGRVNHDGQVVIGKVFSYPLANSGIWIPYNGKPIRFRTYEILIFNQYKAAALSQDPTEDIRYV